MKTDAFDFHLPETLIADTPEAQRDHSRLLHVTSDACLDRYFYQLPELFDERDVLVLNDTRVIPARLYGKRDDVHIEILLHKELGAGWWKVFARPAKRLRPGQVIDIQELLQAEVESKYDSGEVVLRFNLEGDAFKKALEQVGQTPLPPYIEREQGANAVDAERYQTVYAKHAGSVAAPTAGLHFTKALLDVLQSKGVDIHYVTLHVGGGTFLPVKAEDIADHQMHSEAGIVTAETVEALNVAKQEGKRITAVGTTSMRILESAASVDSVLAPFHQETDIFITPGYAFRFVDRLITNFHLPRSTLFMLVSAFSGLERMQRAYAHAMDAGYRFYSYGDACLLERC